MSERAPIVGIDLGTTNSLVAVYDEGGPRILAPNGGDAILPSVVRFESDGSVVVGRDAADEAVRFPTRTITSVKRLMGRSVADASSDIPILPYAVESGEHKTARVRLPGDDDGSTGRLVSPQEVSAEILRTLRDIASTALGVTVQRAVVTVPAYFDDAQRQATRDAGRLAGLDVVRIVSEPTAAALAYGLGADAPSEPRTVAVYDLGGGTFDVSVLRILPSPGDAEQANEEPAFFQVLATSGDTRLGGDDMTRAIVETFLTEIRQQLGLDSASASMNAFPPETRRALIAFADAVKIRLSEADTAAVRIELGEGRAYERTVSRSEFEAMIAPLVDRSIAACRRALSQAERAQGEPVELDAVVLVGGATRVPLVRARVEACFGLEPYTALDPDRVVALGAAVQAGILDGTVRGSLLLDVIPLSLGIETRGGAVAKLIVANSTVPARATETFSTSVDGQVSIKIHVLQGEREMAEDCRSLGEFHLAGLPPMPAGIPKLEVEFLVDASGVLRVSAHEARSGKRATLQVVPNHGLSREEVDRIERDSLTHAREDMTRHRVVDLIVNTRLDLHWIGERFERFGGKLTAEQRGVIATKLEEARGYIERAEADWRSVDADAFAEAKQSLDEASVPLQEIGIAQSLREDAAG
ncbi:MAG: Hsp70 family protein [Planctomycetota bacterium]